MRLAINALHAHSGGARSYLRSIIPVLARQAGPGEHLDVIGRPGQEDLVDGPLERVTFHGVNCPVSSARSFLWEQRFLGSLAAGLGADVLFCPQNYGPLRSPVPVVIHIRNSLAAGRHARGLSGRLYWNAILRVTGWSIRRAARVCAVSRTVAEEVRGLFALEGSLDIRIIPHGIHPRFAPNAAEEPPPDGLSEGAYLLFVSDIYPHKNLPRLVKAFGRLAKTHPRLVLAVIGRELDRESAEEARREARRSGVSERIRWTGPVPGEELPRYYRHAAALVFPSLAESFGNPPLEAMASGTPVIAARAGAMPEICGDAAVYFEPTDDRAMATAIGRVLGDPELAAGLRRKGLERAKAFSWDESATRLLEVVRDASATQAPARGGVTVH